MRNTLMKTAAALLAAVAMTAQAMPAGVVHKSASCDCCDKWVAHANGAGLATRTVVEADMDAVKDRLKVPERLRSCHTAVIGGYVFEGHVPADLVRKVLRERPKIAGLAVPGMPPGSPGMETANGYKASYKVVAFDAAGRESLYATR